MTTPLYLARFLHDAAVYLGLAPLVTKHAPAPPPPVRPRAHRPARPHRLAGPRYYG